MNRLVRLLLIILLAALPLTVAGPAGATSCAVVEGATPQNLLAGRPLHGETLFERYDLAVIGTVTAIRTDEAQGGATRTTVDVHAAFNVAQLPTAIDISSDDPGWMNGYAFQRGSTYFIPLEHPGPQGQPHYSFVCDPVAELAGPGATAELESVAADNDVPLARLVVGDPPAAAPAAGGLSMGRVAVIAGLAVLAMLGVVSLAAGTSRRRGRTA